LFVLIQLVLIIDFAHGWAESWVEKYEDTESKCYYFGKFLSLKLTDAMHTLLKGGCRDKQECTNQTNNHPG
jgi:hypothetical protein